MNSEVNYIPGILLYINLKKMQRLVCLVPENKEVWSYKGRGNNTSFIITLLEQIPEAEKLVL